MRRSPVRVRSLAPGTGVPVGVSQFLILDLTRTNKCVAPVERCSMRAGPYRHYICNLIGERCCINRWRYLRFPKTKTTCYCRSFLFGFSVHFRYHFSATKNNLPGFKNPNTSYASFDKAEISNHIAGEVIVSHIKGFRRGSFCIKLRFDPLIDSSVHNRNHFQIFFFD